jgi:hypothetical protein
LPPLWFGNEAVIFLATEGYSVGPTSLSISSIRRCRRTGVIVVTSTETHSMLGYDSPTRGFAAARIPRRVVEGARVVFVDRKTLRKPPQ